VPIAVPNLSCDYANIGESIAAKCDVWGSMRGVRRFIFGLMFVINIGLALCLGYLFIGRGYFVVAGFTSVEVVTIVLAALAVMLTALGIFIAVLAIWGYQSLRTSSGEIAREAAETLVKSQLPALLRRELEDQTRTDNVLGEDQGISQSAVNSLDGDAK